jgi:hypothetical protein
VGTLSHKTATAVVDPPSDQDIVEVTRLAGATRADLDAYGRSNSCTTRRGSCSFLLGLAATGHGTRS